MKTTLNEIRKHSPCLSGWSTLLCSLNKTGPDDEPVTIAYIAESNGLDDALWCLRAIEGHDRPIRLFAIWCARQVRHLMTDPRSLAALDAAEAYANGEITGTELAAARAAALGAAGAAAWAAALGAAWAAALGAAGAAARDAQRAHLIEMCHEHP